MTLVEVKDGYLDLLERLTRQNGEFAADKFFKRERRAVVRGQSPRTIVLCCSDSRVPPELIFREHGLGKLFVVRTAGHVLDGCTLESVLFAIESLPATLVIVLGHEKCEAVRAAFNANIAPRKPGHLQERFPIICQYIAPAAFVAQAIGLKHGLSRSHRVNLAVEENATRTAHQLWELLSSSSSSSSSSCSSPLHIVSAVYSLGTGCVQWLWEGTVHEQRRPLPQK